MKGLIKQNRRQKIFLAEHGLKPENWKIEKETPEYLYVVSKNGQHRLLLKNQKSQISYETGGYIVENSRIKRISKNFK